MSDIALNPLATVVAQHVAETAILRSNRAPLGRAPHIRLNDLHRFDDRLAAHLDGIAVAGEFGTRLAEAALESPGMGEVYTAVMATIQGQQRIDKLLLLVETTPEAYRGLVAALGWVTSGFLKDIVTDLLASSSRLRRCAALACCAMHRVDPGKALDAAVLDADPALRARALRAAGELSRRDLSSVCLTCLEDKHPACRFWAAWSAVLLGDRRNALDVLKRVASIPGSCRERALQLALKATEVRDSQAFLQTLAPDPKNLRVLIQGSGIAGDPFYVPWLIKHMQDPKVARLAGESFAFVTGLDIFQGFDTQQPEGLESGPSEDSTDESVDMGPDEGLPWPDPTKIQKWWGANKHRFQLGVRYFIGEPVNIDNCKRVLREGYQRQRIAAALYLSLLQPGTPLFPTSAPAWRQQRLLAKMG